MLKSMNQEEAHAYLESKKKFYASEYERDAVRTFFRLARALHKHIFKEPVLDTKTGHIMYNNPFITECNLTPKDSEEDYYHYCIAYDNSDGTRTQCIVGIVLYLDFYDQNILRVTNSLRNPEVYDFSFPAAKIEDTVDLLNLFKVWLSIAPQQHDQKMLEKLFDSELSSYYLSTSKASLH